MNIETIKQFLNIVADKKRWNIWTDEVTEWVGNEDICYMAGELLKDIESDVAEFSMREVGMKGKK